jgi:single-strand DNA-binding protein
MADLNKVFLMGSLTADPELRRTTSGTAVTELRMVTSRYWMTRDGDRREEKLYIDITVWDRQAENCCQFLRKGSGIHVEGSLKMDTWDDKNTGEKRSKVRVHADRVQFLEGRRGDSGGDDESGGAPHAAREPSRRAPSPPGRPGGASHEPRGPANGPSLGSGYSSSGVSEGQEQAGSDEAPEDDIPF